uniref:Eukaryotic translation initiation factor 4B n=1 Tax=Heterorhabditis bacteriophora TaxID=37862 RepID=A0A1I7XGP3_HETBA
MTLFAFKIIRQKDERCLEKDMGNDHAVRDEWSSKEERIPRTEQEREKGNRRMDRNQNQGEERAGERRQRNDVRVVRNVRGRGGYGAGGSNNRYDRHGSHRDRFDREDRNRDLEGYHIEHRGDEREYENHRRGVMRGTVRGGQSNYGTQRQYTRTFSSTYRGGIKEGNNVRSDEYRIGRGRNTGFERNGRSDGYVPRDSGNYYPESSISRGGYSTRTQRGGYSNRSSSRGGYSTRGFSGPKRYSVQRGDAPPQHYSNMPRQPTDVVYFDPSQQINRQPPPPREKKIIEIVPPSA